MNIELLKQYNGLEKSYSVGEYIFRQGDISNFFYALISGEVRAFSSAEDGREFTHQTFKNLNWIGVPPAIINKAYPSNAIATTESQVLKIEKENFYAAAKEDNQLYLELLQGLSNLWYYRCVMMSEISLHSPERRVLTLLNQLKEKEGVEVINFTRQELADKVALRVETVIRTIKKLEEKEVLSIVKGKIYY